ncbi:MAG: hypothetical protein J5704_01455 [Paludibacteraceae bacterium]|nr:hypothetical protein [Paludibacteraceae bacterium]
MKKLSFLLAVVALTLFAGCGPKRSQAYYDQPSVVMSAEYNGTYIIRVQVRAKDAVVAFTEAQRKVVKELIFDGIKAGNAGVSDLKPLCFDKNAQEKYEDYWNAFFSDNGPWKQFTSYKERRVVTTKYERDGRQMIETGTVTADRAGLKKKLQEDGIIPMEGRY